MVSVFFRHLSALTLAILVSSCDSDGGNGAGAGGLENRVKALISENGIVPLPVIESTANPVDDPIEILGQQLYFSRTLSGNFDIACASCHHPGLKGGDGLSLAVGVGAVAPEKLGPGRQVNPDHDFDPSADGGPNVPRNSQTVFNSVLYQTALLHDGRVFIDQAAGNGIRTPESGLGVSADTGGSLLAAQAILPVVSQNEMRGYAYPDIDDPAAYRNRIMNRISGSIDKDKLSEAGPSNWLLLFRQAFPDVPEEQLFSFDHVQQALASYQASMLLTDSPWNRYVSNNELLTEQAMQGAILFFTSPDNGGLGCVSCHSGSNFTNEKFYNVAMPQLGRGKRSDHRDYGRWQVATDQQIEANSHAFRVPSLLNVTATGPWSHAGAFDDLASLLRYHANPVSEILNYDFSFSHLEQFSQSAPGYSYSRKYTEEMLQASSFQGAAELLPMRQLRDEEVVSLIAFLDALLDDCMLDGECLARWVPESVDDPDGNMLVSDVPFVVSYEATNGASLQRRAELEMIPLPVLAGFPDAQGCGDGLAVAQNTGQSVFIRKESQLGLAVGHEYAIETWLGGTEDSVLYMDATMMSGGLAASYLDADCWPDIVYSPGSVGETMLLQNIGGQNGFNALTPFSPSPGERVSGFSVADLNGDYRREIIMSNLHAGGFSIYSPGGAGEYYRATTIAMGRNSQGVAIGDIDQDDFPDIYVAHWSMVGLPGTAPAMWRNEAGLALVAADADSGTTSADVPQQFNFSPAFADLDLDGDQDLLVASDFLTSSVLENDGAGTFTNVTDRAVISDRNGMGSAVADFDNDGLLDWFVTSIYSIFSPASGNQLYRNVSGPEGVLFQNVTGSAGVKDGGWGWGACAYDFNNDGWVDIFHTNGYTNYPDALVDILPLFWLIGYDVWLHERHSRSRLFINQGDGTFVNQAASWSINEAIDGRGVVCFDYDRDGDIDIGLLEHSKGIRFFENQSGSGTGRHFLAVHLVGDSPNTEALGARVVVETSGPQGALMQTRVVQANSNFNSQNPPDLHFGLGSADSVDKLTVFWPDGETLECQNIPPNRFLVIDSRWNACEAP